MRLAGVVCLLVGCSFEHGQGAPIDGKPLIDAPLIDGPPGCKSFSTHVDTCTQLLPNDPLALTGVNTYDTDDLVLTTPGGTVTLPTRVITTADGAIVVAFVSTFSMAAGATLRVEGSDMDRPLGIVATGAIVIDGAIDVSNNGAGARNDALCGAQAGNDGADDNGGGSGGGGGGFAGAGGKGGNGDNDGGMSSGAAAGTARARPAHILGGCDGGPGGQGMGEDDNAGEAGDGGGAIFLASSASITVAVNGSINAGGGGGRPGRGNGGGGGGGGSGGMIVLESNEVTINGKVAANGGGGGEGADGTNGSPGSPGGLATARATGGNGASNEGADGGSGGASANTAGDAPTQVRNGGGGGGGGGAGFIGIGDSSPTTSGSTVISPAYQAWP